VGSVAQLPELPINPVLRQTECNVRQRRRGKVIYHAILHRILTGLSHFKWQICK